MSMIALYLTKLHLSDNFFKKKKAKVSQKEKLF